MGIRIIVCGNNGSGKSTLGRVLSEKLMCRFMDNEDYYFPRTELDYKYLFPRTYDEVVRLIESDMYKYDNWILASVKGNYGEKCLQRYTHAILIDVPKEISIKRVYERSFSKFGNRILPGGDLYQYEKRFFEMIAERDQRYAEEWFNSLKCKLLKVDGTKLVGDNVELILEWIKDSINTKGENNGDVRNFHA